jgi:serine/threonine protein kinase
LVVQAVKVLSKKRLGKMKKMIMSAEEFPEWINGMDEVKSEIQILEYISNVDQHPGKEFIINNLQVFEDPEKDAMFIISEYYENGHLLVWNDEEKRFSFKFRENNDESKWIVPPKLLRKFIGQICLVLNFLKDQDISHRDIKVNSFG